MKSLRRFCSLVTLLIAPIALLGVRGGAKPAPGKSYRAYVGTYTAKTNSKGIYEFQFDGATGKMSAVEVAGDTKDPSWVVVHPGGKYLYSVNETGKASTVSSFAIDSKNGKLTLLNQLPSLGEDPCYLSFDQTGKFLLVANYTSGTVAAFPILADGKLAEHTGLQQHSGMLGPNKERQDGPHAHYIAPSAQNRLAYAADLGLDRVLIYEFDSAKGSLGQPETKASVEVAPGTGPRHIAFSSSAKFMYVVGEMTSTVTVLAKENQGTFHAIQTAKMLPAGFSGRNDAAEIEIHPSGKFLYASNRGHDSIVVYAINQANGLLRQIADVPTGGKEPRHFAIDPSGTFLLAENQLSDTIVEFRLNTATGELTPTGETLSVPSPVCLVFVPAK
jgi:6-phosphogluconolactonase